MPDARKEVDGLQKEIRQIKDGLKELDDQKEELFKQKKVLGKQISDFIKEVKPLRQSRNELTEEVGSKIRITLPEGIPGAGDA